MCPGGKEGVLCSFELLFLAVEREARNLSLKLGTVICTAAWESSILREVDKGAEEESTCRGRLWKAFFFLF